MSTSGTSPLARAKQAYAGSMKALGSTLDRFGLIDDEAPPVGQRYRHWVHSLTKVYDSAAMARLDVPWWTYGAIAEVGSWLAARPRPIRIFEYGSGASTVWLARRSDEVHSVEHHAEFGAAMLDMLADVPRAKLRVIPPVPSVHPREPSQKEGHAGLDFSEYVASIDDVDGEFDLIVVDGRAREACLARSLDRLAPEGIIVFDNSRRRRYREAIAASGLREQAFDGLTPTLPYPERTSILTRP